MARILRGEIYWANLAPGRGHEQEGRRPVLVLSRETYNDRSGTIIAMAITSKPQDAGFPLTYHLPDSLLSKPSWVKVGQIHTLSVERLGKKCGHLTEGNLDQIIEGLLDLIGR